jgi:hypothetical protein
MGESGDAVALQFQGQRLALIRRWKIPPRLVENPPVPGVISTTFLANPSSSSQGKAVAQMIGKSLDLGMHLGYIWDALSRFKRHGRCFYVNPDFASAS